MSDSEGRDARKARAAAENAADVENALAQAEAGWGRVGGGWCGDRDCGIPGHNHKPYEPPGADQ